MNTNATTALPQPATTANARTPLLVLALLLVDGLHFVFARALHAWLPPLTSVLFVMATASAEIVLFAVFTKRFHLNTFLNKAPFFLTVGGLVALSTSINYVAVGFVDPGTASLLSQSSIVFGLALGLVWLRDKLTQQQFIGAALCITGVVVITFQPGDYFRIGSLMIIGGSLIYALHAATVKRFGGGVDFVEFFMWRVVCTTGFVLLAAASQQAVQPPPAGVWPLIVIAGTVDVIISRSLYYLALRRLSVSIHTLVFTLSPVIAGLWSLALFGTQPSMQQLLGGMVVMLGVLIASLAKRG
jgi:drug/metabolite transporter (DMT)-like permease